MLWKKSRGSARERVEGEKGTGKWMEPATTRRALVAGLVFPELLWFGIWPSQAKPSQAKPSLTHLWAIRG